MEYLRGWRAFRRDPKWHVKVAYGCVAILSGAVIPIAGQALLLGFCARIAQNAARDRFEPMPHLDIDFDYLAKLLVLGLKALVVQLVWSLPVIAFSMLGYCCFIGALQLVLVEGDGEPAWLVAIGIGFAFANFLILLVMSLPIRAAVTLAELEGEIMAGLDFRRVMAFTRTCFRELFVGTLVLSGFSLALALLGTVCCVIGVVPAAVIIQIVSAYFSAELYRRWLEKGAPPAKIPTDLDHYDG